MNPITVHRAGTVLTAAVLGLLAWAGLRAGGADLEANAHTVGAVDVIVTAMVAGAGAWVTSRILARVARPRTTWMLLSTTLLSASMLGPIYSAPALTAVALMGLHLVVGAVLIGGFASTLAFRRPAPDAQRHGIPV